MEVPITREPCPNCEFIFWVPTSFYNKRMEDHERFYCPSCRGGIYYPNKTDMEICQEESDRLKYSLRIAETAKRSAGAARDRTERRRISQKGATTRLRRKLAAFVDGDAS